MGNLVKTVAAASEPFDLAAAKAHLNIVDETDDDVLITALIGAARSSAETTLKKTLLATTWQWSNDCFLSEFYLPIGPVLEASANIAILYTDDAGAEQTLATTEYQVSYGETARIRPAYGKTWPTTRAEMDAVRITFTSGLADAADIEPAIIAAVKMILGDMYENRENNVIGAAVNPLPTGAHNLLVPFIRYN